MSGVWTVGCPTMRGFDHQHFENEKTQFSERLSSKSVWSQMAHPSPTTISRIRFRKKFIRELRTSKQIVLCNFFKEY